MWVSCCWSPRSGMPSTTPSSVRSWTPRKATKGGKFIPWIRAFSFPMAVLCVLGFVNVGNINYGLRLAYMFITYVLYEALYTCVNVPFGTLSSVMTDDVSQRTALSRYRSLGGTIFMTVMVMIGPCSCMWTTSPWLAAS